MWPWFGMCLALAPSAMMPDLSAGAHPVVEALAVRRQAARQGPQKDRPKVTRAAVLRAMVVLKIAPYLRSAKAKSAPAKKPFRIAVVGSDNVALAIRKRLPGKSMRKRRVKVVALAANQVLNETTPQADMLYLAESVGEADVARIVARYKKLAVPLVSERAGFAASGGGIQLFVKSNALRFEINAGALKEQGVRASPQLLKLSKRGPRK